ncbi:hypothetical protein ABIB25_000959 [Nakamurella sp. UYEF19]
MELGLGIVGELLAVGSPVRSSMGWVGIPVRRISRLWDLWDTDQINRLYTVSDLGRFKSHIVYQATLRGYRSRPDTPPRDSRSLIPQN